MSLHDPNLTKDGQKKPGVLPTDDTYMSLGPELAGVPDYFGAGNTRKIAPNIVQPKLEINQPGDEYEKEADEIAEMVVQRKAETSDFNPLSGNQNSGDKQFSEGGWKPNSLASTIRRKSNTGGLDAGIKTGSGFESQLNSKKGSGSPLPDSVRGRMESGFGTDFSGVRLHTDSSAVQMSREINAQAFTHGQDIYFNSGKLDTNSSSGQKLLAHELTHTVQQRSGLSLMRTPEPDDPSLKPDFHRLPNPAQSQLVIFSAKIRKSNDAASEEISTIYSWDSVFITWASPTWVYCTVGRESGYLEKRFLDEITMGTWLNTVNISPESFKGDLDGVASETNNALNSTTFWVHDVDESRLMNALPTNLDAKQIGQLKGIYNKKYKKTLLSDLYENTKPGKFGSGYYLFKAMERVSTLNNESGNLSINANFNTVAIGATVEYEFSGPKPHKVHNTGPRGDSHPYDINPKHFVPRVLIWLVHEPNDDVDSHYTKNALEDTYSFSPGENGIYSVMAVVLLEGGSYLILRDLVFVKTKEQIMSESFKELSEMDSDFFYKLYAEQSAKKAALTNVITDNQNSNIYGNSNPAHMNGTNERGYQITYQLKNYDPDEEFVWYYTPSYKSIYGSQGNWFFNVSHERFITRAELNDGTEAYSRMEIKKPQKNLQSYELYFPMTSRPPYEPVTYTVNCIRYKNGHLTGADRYIQYYYNAERTDEVERRDEIYELKSNLKKMEEVQAKIDGDVYPIKTVYLNEETGRSLPLLVFYGKSKENPGQYILIDLTKGAETTYFDGVSLESAMRDFDNWNSYPDGWIIFRHNGKDNQIETTGGSLIYTFGSWAGWISILYFIGGVAAAIIPGAEGAAPVLFALAFTYGTAAAILGLIDNLAKDKVNEERLLLDVLALATTFAMGAGIGLKALGTAREVGFLLSASKCFYYSAIIGNTVQGVIIVESGVNQIDEILKNDKLSPQERLLRLSQVIAQLVFTVGLIVFSHSDSITLKSSLKAKGVPENTLSHLERNPEAMMLVNSLSKEEIALAIRKNENLITSAKNKVRVNIERQQQAAWDDAFNRHYGRNKPDGKPFTWSQGNSGGSLEELALANRIEGDLPELIRGVGEKIYKPNSTKDPATDWDIWGDRFIIEYRLGESSARKAAQIKDKIIPNSGGKEVIYFGEGNTPNALRDFKANCPGVEAFNNYADLLKYISTKFANK